MKQGDLFSEGLQDDAPERAAPRSPGRARSQPVPRPAPLVVSGADEPGDPPEDADDRRRAVTTFDAPVLLEAGAGTGKTATLVARVLTWCLGPGWERRDADGQPPEDVAVAVLGGVVAITFTEAAAAEMATRVGQALAQVQRATDGVAPDTPLEALPADALPPGLALDLLPGTAALFERARALRAALDALDVGTIHAFCRRLLAAHPLELGLAPDFEVDAAGSRTVAVVRDVLEEFLQEAWGDQLDPRLLTLARENIGPPKLEQALLELLDQGARADDLARDPFDDQACAGLVDTVGAALQGLAEAIGDAFAGVPANQTTHDALGALADSVTALATLPALDEASPRGRFDALAGALRAAWSRRATDKLKKWRKEGPGPTERRGADDERCDRVQARAEELEKRLLPFTAVDVDKLDVARRVLHQLLERVEAQLRRRGVATFNDLLVQAARLMTEHPGVARRERERIDQLLVDEFQDTDWIQCELVRALGLPPDPEERAAAPCLFLVGDPKQSIFAWRNADLAAYDQLKRGVEQAGGALLALTVNFRSRPAVLAEVERCVRPVMEELEGVQPAFAPLVPHRAPADPERGATVEHWVSWPQDEATGQITPANSDQKGLTYRVEARALALDVRARRTNEGLRWKQFGVVFRAQTNIEPYLAALREHGVPYEVQSDRKYYQRREVVDATALVRAVLDPNDLVALVTLLRSPLVGLPDAALLPLWEARFPARLASLWGPDEERLAELEELVRAAAARVPPDVPGLDGIDGWPESVVAALHALADARRAFRTLPADAWIEHLRALFLPDATEAARFLGAYRLANLERFFRELLRAVDERAGDVQAILRTLRANLSREDKNEASRPADSEQDALQVMTVHGSKGLEFAHLYFAQTHKDEGRGSSGSTTFDHRGGVTSYKLFAQATPSFYETRALRDEAERAERVRLLYVVLTRARDRLVVLGAWNLPPKARGWRDAKRMLDLVEQRAGATEALTELARRAAALDPAPHVDAHGVHWRLAALIGSGPVRPDRGEPEHASDAGPAPLDVVARDARALAGLRAEALTHERRPFSGRPSDVHGELDPGLARQRALQRYDAAEADDVAPLKLGREAAKLVGTLVHRVLEDGLAATTDVLAAELAHLWPDASEKARADALARAAELFQRGAPLVERLATLDVVARELPVLLPPADGREDAPVGFVSGSIDLVYRDATGALVVVDYKTDQVEGAEELAERAALYHGQAATYARAVQDALGLDSAPRAELWFLHAAEVVPVE